MNITQKLMDEHSLILKYVDALEKLCNQSTDEIVLDKGSIAIDFIINYADKYHHAKEENILFEIVQKPGVLEHCNPIPQMLHEHEQGRTLVKGMKLGISENNADLFKQNALQYCQLLSEHIHKEDHILYPMCESSIDIDSKTWIHSEYQKVEQQYGSSFEESYTRKLNAFDMN